MKKSEVINKLSGIINNLAEKHSWLKGKKSLALAQIIIESGWLKHSPGNNCLGIKWTSHYPESMKQMLMTSEWVNGKYVRVKAPFVKFDSIEQCIEKGYIRILKLSRYKETRDSVDWFDATSMIRINGYATSPTYTNTLRRAILGNKLYEADWEHDYYDPITRNFVWGETFSNVRIGPRTYRRVIEPPGEYWEDTIDLAEQLQIGRDFIGKPFVINSWYRTNDYNAYVGGVPGSQHKFSNAVDVRTPRGVTSRGFYLLMDQETDCTGFGIGRRFCHFDRKKNVPKRVWYY